MSFAWDPSWDDSDELDAGRPWTTAYDDSDADSTTGVIDTEEDIGDAILANELACQRRAWYEIQNDHDLQQFIVKRGIEVPTSGVKTLREDMIGTIMAQLMERAARDATLRKKEDFKRRAWYGKQSDDVLSKFISKRRIELPFNSSTISKGEYIDALMARDKEMRFTFEDLPPELRNRIYSYVLIDQGQQAADVDEKPRISCYPNILAVSKNITKEAWNVLYSNAYVTLDLKFYRAGSMDEFKIDCIDPPTRSASSTKGTQPRRRSRARRASATRILQQPLSINQIQVQMQGQIWQTNPLNNQVQATPMGQFTYGNHIQHAPINPSAFDPPTQHSSDTSVRRDVSILHNEIICKVGHVNIRITIAQRAVLESEERTTEIRQIVTELKDYMAKHAGREQTVSVTFDLKWDKHAFGGQTSDVYKKDPANKQHIFNDAIKILEPLSQVGEMKDYGHLAACQKMEVIFIVPGDIGREIAEKLEGKKQEVEKKTEEKKLSPTTLGCLVLTPAQLLQNEIDSRVTESIFKRHWREDTWSNEDEDHAYTLSPKKKLRDDNLWDADAGKDDDSAHFDTDDNEDMQDDDGEELFSPEDLEDEDYDLNDLIVDATPGAEPSAFHPDVANREVQEWLNNGGFRSELNNLREARVLALDKKKEPGSGQQGQSLFGNN